MYFEHIYKKGLAHSSYLAGSRGECVVVDPSRDVSKYIQIASSQGFRISAVIETHLHADFISGHMELADRTGAKIYAPESARCSFSHLPVPDGGGFSCGELNFKMLETPGHTPESSVWLVSDMERGAEPVMVFTGDTLLVGDAGRPDLFPDKKEILAEKLFYSLHRIKELPERMEVYPAHGMGSLCGRSLSAKLSSTIGNEMKYNYAFAYEDIEEFKKVILTGMPEAPDHFARCSEINRKGPELISSLGVLRELEASEFNEGIQRGAVVLDIRNNLAFASGNVAGSCSIDMEGNLPLFAGWIIPPEKSVLLVTPEGGFPQGVLEALYSVGIEKVEGYLKDGIYSWLAAGYPSSSVNTVSPKEMISMLSCKNVIVLDNRLNKEWLSGHIKGSILMPAPEVRHRWEEISKSKTIITVCASGTRSMTAASILKQKGFKAVFNLLGGMEAWSNCGYPVEVADHV